MLVFVYAMYIASTVKYVSSLRKAPALLYNTEAKNGKNGVISNIYILTYIHITK